MQCQAFDKFYKLTCGHQRVLVKHCLLCNFQVAQPSLLLQLRYKINNYIVENASTEIFYAEHFHTVLCPNFILSFFFSLEVTHNPNPHKETLCGFTFSCSQQVLRIPASKVCASSLCSGSSQQSTCAPDYAHKYM